MEEKNNIMIDNERLFIELTMIEDILMEMTEYNLGLVSKEKAIENAEATRIAVTSSRKIAMALMLKQLLNREK